MVLGGWVTEPNIQSSRSLQLCQEGRTLSCVVALCLGPRPGHPVFPWPQAEPRRCQAHHSQGIGMEVGIKHLATPPRSGVPAHLQELRDYPQIRHPNLLL